MSINLKKIFTKDSELGRLEYIKIVLLCLFSAILLVFSSSLIPPGNILLYPLLFVFLICIAICFIIFFASVYKRFLNIFLNKFISVLFFVTYIISIPIKMMFYPFILLNIILFLVKGKNKSDIIISAKKFWLIFMIITAMIISFRVAGFNYRIVGKGMSNTLIPRDFFIVNIFTKDYKRGDIIIYERNKMINISRIAALPGEKIEIKELPEGTSSVYINDEKLNEPYITNTNYKKSPKMEYLSATVPEGYYYVLGDNRANSLDSRFYGAVNKDLIKGKINHIWFPIKRRQVILPPQY